MNVKTNHLYTIDLLNTIFPISPKLIEYLHAKLKFTKYKKGEHICNSGEECDKMFVLQKGLVRGYFISGGKEITTWISCDRELVTSISGFFKRKASVENIQCLEDTSAEYLLFDDLKYGMEIFPEMVTLYRILLEQYYIYAEDRAFLARIPGALERFRYFNSTYQRHLLKRAPYKYLASLLAMRPETFSRILTEFREE
ncbi:Crp/Fnr family transcriptional regulator [Aquiflexum sp.]|uniref:Crp/Fnr family transcriptional regulator n=1 Tax=Aquiflexum sp. TaxID=1872584 RepID=UPI00359435CA